MTQPLLLFWGLAPSPNPAPETLPLDFICVGKKWRLGRQQGSVAVLRAIGGKAFLAGVMVLPVLTDSV
jgi:hypothetical protein